MSESAAQQVEEIKDEVIGFNVQASGDNIDAQFDDAANIVANSQAFDNHPGQVVGNSQAFDVHTDPVVQNSHQFDAPANAPNSSQFAAAVLAQRQARVEGVAANVVRPNGPPDDLDFSEMIILFQVNHFWVS